MAFALVDCESFYASCERIFRPDLKNIPIVVLSNNDGCVIARSTEAKKMGIGMGVPRSEERSKAKWSSVFVKLYILWRYICQSYEYS